MCFKFTVFTRCVGESGTVRTLMHAIGWVLKRNPDQLYSYCVTAQLRKNLSWAPKGVLLAVHTEDGLGRNLNFTLGEYPIRVRLIDLTGDISSIHDSLDEALEHL